MRRGAGAHAPLNLMCDGRLGCPEVVKELHTSFNRRSLASAPVQAGPGTAAVKKAPGSAQLAISNTCAQQRAIPHSLPAAH